jgi:prepilin-type N-terminal cleavage/methylation domain-containing protein
MKKTFSTIRAFTLIELLVVIAIIAILTGIILTSLTGSKAKGRDAQRVSDIGQIQLALELYFDRCHQYPIPSSGKINPTVLNEGIATCVDSSSNQIPLSTYISVIPQSPAGGSVSAGYYDYVANSSQTDYILHTSLESSNNAQQNSLPELVRATDALLVNNSITSSFTCYDNTSANLNYCVGPK